MFFIQEAFTEEDAMVFLESFNIEENGTLRSLIIDPIISVLETPRNRKEYIQYGDEFLEANSDMLSKEYPTKAISFPRKYVDNIFKLFGFEQKDFKERVKETLKSVNDKSTFATIVANPTNVIHTIVLIYSDMVQNRQLRDSARQQMGLSVYNNIFNKFFHPPHPIEATMAYVYMNLDNSWNLVKSANVMTWIGNTVETAYGCWRTKLDLDLSPTILVKFLNRVRTSFQQNIRLLANQYYNNLDKGNMVGSDVDSNDEYLETTNTSKIRDSLIRRINSGDQLYRDKGNLYSGIARLKNVKVDALYDYSQQIDSKDIGMIMDTIFYVFIVKEGNTIDDINTTKFISRITNLPTAIDRAIAGKPIIDTLSKKYKVDQLIVKAHICLVATYIMYRINDTKN